MGLVRFGLALSVVLAHVGDIRGYKILDGATAVEAFFMISGFYMALILNEKYVGPNTYWLFLSNRLLRVFPVYYVVLLASLLYWLVSGGLVADWGPLRAHESLPTWATLYIRLTDFTVVGQDVIPFLAVPHAGAVRVTPDLWAETGPALWRFMLVPTAWSLSLELMFYLVAPLLVRRRAAALVLVFLLSLGLRLVLVFALGLRQDPWSYRFFPTELGLFVAGALAYKIVAWVRPLLTRAAYRRLAYLCLALYLGLLFGYDYLLWFNIGGTVRRAAFLGSTWLALPLLFAVSRSAVDRYIGELSYPLYLIHFLMISVVPRVMASLSPSYSLRDLSPFDGPHVNLARVGVVVASVAASVALHQTVSVPLERHRQARVKRAQQAPA